MLMNHTYAPRDRIIWASEINFFTFNDYVAFIRPVHAKQNVHKGAFTRSVFT